MKLFVVTSDLSPKGGYIRLGSADLEAGWPVSCLGQLLVVKRSVSESYTGWGVTRWDRVSAPSTKQRRTCCYKSSESTCRIQLKGTNENFVRGAQIRSCNVIVEFLQKGFTKKLKHMVSSGYQWCLESNLIS